MSTRAASFRIDCSACLDATGKPIGKLPDFAGDAETLASLYAAMVRTRAFDAKAVALQRTGRLGTYGSSLGQEAIGVGVASAMRAEDVLLPSFREHGAQLWRGVTLEELFLYWGGDERGNDFAGPRRDFPVCIPVASQFPHAAGVALALVQRGEPGVAVAMGGDGATSKGDFYEALNLAGAWDLPVVFVISNNQWAISVRRREQTGAGTLAQKAIAGGLPGEQVDGNDVIAVRAATERALARARDGQGGCLIECLTYRLGDHTTADDASRYREDEEVSVHWKEEPLVRLRNFLVARHDWDKAREEALLREVQAEVEAAADRYLAIEPAPRRAMFDHLHATLPPDIAALAEEAGDG
ncbi:pyruvate dehydrogenase (acetyl-transferring) E1 component subunit alpha [Defluviimonas sp. D31]|uniref:pyruvate dehydrogenase (acetyl-transferring) E1 component subunit alpha n=1 Tax=Defluviimonas sp. D31 TaxID=3083253 RepID=UPI00296E82F9|nr:pyruvate dehydrogenase (acetyl-transferring) E1 component subunit alpha [Defluviimonas sp. D31]MDW4551159.1 pyruvate dehydrogenase (acetyl-transferring) E1 component subunit alpha [Defluviimonas sp. D31]